MPFPDLDNIDPRWVDADFRQHPNYVFGDLGVRAFGPRLRDFADVVPDIPDSEFPRLAEEMKQAGGGLTQLVTRICNQKNEGSCVANAFVQAAEIKQAEQFGRDRVVPLSAISLYKRIGSSPNSGAMVDDGIEELTRGGAVPLDTPENRARFGGVVMPHTGFYTKYPAGWEAVAKQFAGHEWYAVRSVTSLITALFKGFPVVVGRQGHSICYCDVVYRNGQLGVVYANSWDYSWGFAAGSMRGGFGLDTLSQVRMSATWAAALRSVVVPPDNPST